MNTSSPKVPFRAKTSLKAKKPKTCKCIAMVNKALKSRKAQLVGTLRLKRDTVPKVIVATETDGDAIRHKFNPTMLAANFCPFCGIQYP